MHDKVPFPIVMTCQLTRYPEGVSNRISCRRSVAAACSAGARFICGPSICLPPDRPLKSAREFMELIRANITALQLKCPAPTLVHAASQKRCYLVLVACTSNSTEDPALHRLYSESSRRPCCSSN